MYSSPPKVSGADSMKSLCDSKLVTGLGEVQGKACAQCDRGSSELNFLLFAIPNLQVRGGVKSGKRTLNSLDEEVT